MFGLRYENITILYNEIQINDHKYFDCFINFSGQGCRQFETIQGDDFDWIVWFGNIFTYLINNDPHFSRIDIALDVNGNSVPIMLKLFDSARNHKYVSNFRSYSIHEGSDEQVLYFGSPTSDTRIRIYNKALERGFDIKDCEQWTRFEYQLRNQSASRFLNHIFSEGMTLGQAMIDFLNSSIRFTTKSTDTLKGHEHDRLISCRWWQDLIRNAGEVTKLNIVGIEYNLSKAQVYIATQVAPTLHAFIQAYGGDITVLMQILEDNKYRLKDKHFCIIKEGRERLTRQQIAEEKLHKLRQELFGGLRN